MDSKKLQANIERLGKLIPPKPAHHTDDYPKSLADCLHQYLRQSTLWDIQAAAWIYEGKGWPLPFYVDPQNIRVGKVHQAMLNRFNVPNYKYYVTLAMLRHTQPVPAKNLLQRLRDVKPITFVFLPIFLPYVLVKKAVLSFKKKPNKRYYDYFNAAIIGQFYQVLDLDKLVIDLFETNLNYYRRKVTGNPLLANKQGLLKDIFDTYENQNYAACICSLFPILDFLTREVFNTNKLGRDITSINSIFKAAGYTLDDIDNLKPAAKAVKLNELLRQKKLSHEEYHKIISSDFEGPQLGLPGVALSSFLHFGAKYYDFYRNDTKLVEFNRHAIMHGANDAYANKINCVKLFTYLYLMLEMEPILRIVFNET